MTVPSVQNAMVRTPLTVPAAASTPERSRSCSSSTLPSSKNVLRRSSGSRGSSDSPTASGAMIVIESSYVASDVGCAVGNTLCSVLPEGERDVVPTESERIVDRVLIIAGPRLRLRPRPGRSPGSRFFRFSVGGMMPSRSASTVRMDSTAPTAPTEWPSADLGAYTAGRCEPSALLIALPSATSPTDWCRSRAR